MEAGSNLRRGGDIGKGHLGVFTSNKHDITLRLVVHSKKPSYDLNFIIGLCEFSCELY